MDRGIGEKFLEAAKRVRVISDVLRLCGALLRLDGRGARPHTCTPLAETG